MSRSLVVTGRLAALALVACALGATCAAAAELGVTLRSAESDDVFAADKEALGEVGLRGGGIELVAIVTGDPGAAATFNLPLPSCVRMPAFVTGSMFATEPDVRGVPVMSATELRLEGFALPSTGRVEIRIDSLVIAGAGQQPCCLRATVTGADGRAVVSTAPEAGGQACGGGATGFFVLDSAAPAPAAE